jgi:hypothetical protein
LSTTLTMAIDTPKKRHCDFRDAIEGIGRSVESVPVKRIQAVHVVP